MGDLLPRTLCSYGYVVQNKKIEELILILRELIQICREICTQSHDASVFVLKRDALIEKAKALDFPVSTDQAMRAGARWASMVVRDRGATGI